MSYEIIQGDCLATLKTLPSGSVQTCVTSPPYYGLRDYGHDGQIGLGGSPEAYVAKLVEVFGEVKRVLRDDGTLWLNLGDSYNGSGGAGGDSGAGGLKEGQPKYPGRRIEGLKPKDLIGIPWTMAFALRADGWYLRSDIIWHKPNPMPESVTDRPTKSHEYIFLLSKAATYYYDSEAIREPNSPTSQMGGRFVGDKKSEHTGNGHSGLKVEDNTWNGRNRRSVWTVATQPYSEAHFATFPPALIEPCILAGTSAYGACAACGSPWERVVEREKVGQLRPMNGSGGVHPQSNYRTNAENGRIADPTSTLNHVINNVTLGWQPTCPCGAAADIVPCTVLDPFSGAATTGLVALKHGRKYIGLELNADYITMSHKRLLGVASQPLLFALDAQEGGG